MVPSRNELMVHVEGLFVSRHRLRNGITEGSRPGVTCAECAPDAAKIDREAPHTKSNRRSGGG